MDAGGEAWLDQDLGSLFEQMTGELIPDGSGLARASQVAGVQERALADLGITPLLRGAPGYPKGLERLADPPRVIFVRGQAPPANAVAVVGTREPSAWGVVEARRYAGALARAGVPVLNGLALGIDQAALEAALALGGACVGVLAGEHDVEEEANQGASARGMLGAGSSLVSEYPPGVAAHKGSFIERDRVQAGLSAAVLLIESALDGGTMHTARAAREAGVPLFALLPEDAMAQAHKDPSRLAAGFRGNWSQIGSGAAIRVDSMARFMEAVGTLTGR